MRKLIPWQNAIFVSACNLNDSMDSFKMASQREGGYSYKFVTAPEESLFCHLCQLVARDAQLSVCCGTNFCKQCLGRRASETSGCPACNDVNVVLTAFPNKMSDREIKKLIVLCVNNDDGCDWRDELVKLEDHVASCEMQDVECPLKCRAKLKRVKQDDHLKNECPHRQTNCEHCCMTGEHHVIIGQHRDQCPKLPLSCPNDCGLTDIIRSEMDEHLKKCPLQKTICKYHNIGCKAVLTNENQDEHDEACMKEHFQLMSKELTHTRKELTDTNLRLNRANQFTEQTRNELMEVKLKASKTEQSIEKVTGELLHTKEELVIAQAKVSKVEQNTENMQKEFEARLLKVQGEYHQWKKTSCSVLSSTLPSLDWQTKLIVSGMLLEQLDIVAPVVVKVTSVSAMIKNDETFQSATFFTHNFGYVACLLVTPNGVGHLKGSQLSVSISILNGPNDEKLIWPLKGQFTVILLNQVKNSNHLYQILSRDSGKGNTDSVSPSSTTAASYVRKAFCTQTTLFSVSPARKYLIGDTLYMQVHYSSTH